MKKYIIIIFLMISGAVISCSRKDTKDEAVFPEDEFSDGDLAFRRGMGILSRVVLAADEKGVFSHVGILKQIDGKWYVVHAVPDELEFEGDVDRVKIEPLSKFYAFDKASRGAIMRYDGDTASVHRAAEHAVEIAKRGTLFDHDYNLDDTTKMYCTEMVNFVYAESGIDLSEGRRTVAHIPALGGIYIMPGDISGNKKLELIYQFIR